MSKRVALLLVLVFLTSSCVMTVDAVFSSVDVDEDSWVSKASLQQARAGLGVVAVNGKVYAIGGTKSSTSNAYTGGFVGTNEEYDLETDTWSFKAYMPTPRAYFAVAAYQNKIYCIGGAVGISVNEIGFYSYNTSGVNEVYDTVTNTWKTKKPMPDEAMQFQAHVVNGKIYVIASFHMYVYDPADDSWTTKTRMPKPYPHVSPVSAAVDNKIIVTGEFTTEYSFSPKQKVRIYDTETDSWSEGKSGTTVVGVGAAGATTGVNAPQRVYVLGLAANQYPPPSTNQVYDPETDAWSVATAMPTQRSRFGVAVMNDVLYAIGGQLYSSGEVTGVNEQYCPVGYEVSIEISVVSPKNKAYNSSNVSLVFTVNKPVNWTRYTLNADDNITITGNTTLNELPNGAHNLTMYATDHFGNTAASETVHFNIDVPVTEPFPTVPVVASAAAVAAISAALLVYFKKHKH